MNAADRDREAFEAWWRDFDLGDGVRTARDLAVAHIVWQAALTHARAQAGEPVASAEQAFRDWFAPVELCYTSEQKSIQGRAFGAGFRAGRSAHPAPAQEPVAVAAGMTADEAWQDLCEKDDRTSIDYPGFALIRQDELAGYMAPTPVSPPVEAQGEALKCFICREPILKGQLVLPDYTEGLGHRECFGNDRDGFCNLETGEPLGPDEPLPPGEPYEPEAAPVSPPAESGETEDEMIRRISDASPEEVIAELREQGIDPEAGVKLVDDMAAQAHALASHTPAPQPGGAETDKALADQREANLRARLDKIHSYASAIETLAKGGALPLPTPPAGEG